MSASQSQPALATLALPSRNQQWLTSAGMHISRYSLVLILFWIGIQKFTLAEAEGIQPLVAHSPFMSWMYSLLSVRAVSGVIGAVEISVALLMALRPVSAKASLAGSLGAILTFLATVSFLFTTPAVLDRNYAVPLLSGLGGFLIKDLALLGCAVWTAAEALAHVRQQG
jgi:reactive chlorine resistance protein C